MRAIPAQCRFRSTRLSRDIRSPTMGDRHVLVIDKGNCWLYELYRAFKQPDGSWNADSGAVWDLTMNEQRPYTWTSADAASLPPSLSLAYGRFSGIALFNPG